MKKVFYIIAILLFLGWIAGFFIFHAGTMIHSLAVSAMVLGMQAVIITPKPKSTVNH